MLKRDSSKREKIPVRTKGTHNRLINNAKTYQVGLEEMPLTEQETKAAAIRHCPGKGDARTAQANDTAKTDMHWFVMRDLKRPNAKMPAYKMLSGAHFEIFTPMRPCLATKQGKRSCEDVPFIQDLLFVHSTPEKLDPIVEKTPTLQYRYLRGGKYREPMTVADSDMDKFIHAVRSSETLRYYRPDELTPAMLGRKIRIIGGSLHRYEGCLLKSRKGKYLLVDLPGYLSAAVKVNPEFIQFI